MIKELEFVFFDCKGKIRFFWRVFVELFSSGSGWGLRLLVFRDSVI